MKIRTTSVDTDADYIRQVRTRTLQAIGVEVTNAMIQPVEFATYLVAYSDDQSRMGLGESGMLSDVYRGYSDTPYASLCDLSRFCPIEQMASMRTIYVEPAFRGASLTFMGLALASAKLFHDRGARFAIASTSGSSDYLKRLYMRAGGEVAGEAKIDGADVALFVFDLERALAQRIAQRLAGNFDLPMAGEIAFVAAP